LQLKPDPLAGFDVPLYQLVAAFLCFVFAALAALHFYWAAGGRLAMQDALPTVGDRPLFEPGPLATTAVGFALVSAAVVSALRGDLLLLDLPAWLSRLGTWALALIFAARAIGEFHYVGFFKRVRDTGFARRDSLFYSPLCVLISALAAGLAVLAP
jgi:hypothetical protein